MAIFYLSFLQVNITLKTIIFSDKKFIQSPQKKNNILYLRFSIFLVGLNMECHYYRVNMKAQKPKKHSKLQKYKKRFKLCKINKKKTGYIISWVITK